MLGAAIGSAIAARLLWRAGAALLAVVTAALVYTTAGEFDNYARTLPSPGALVTWLAPALILPTLSQTNTPAREVAWSAKIPASPALGPPTIAPMSRPCRSSAR